MLPLKGYYLSNIGIIEAATKEEHICVIIQPAVATEILENKDYGQDWINLLEAPSANICNWVLQ